MALNHQLISRRNFVLGLGIFAGIGMAPMSRNAYLNQQIKALDNPARNFTVDRRLSLKQLAASKGLMYGSASYQINLSSHPLCANAIVQNCAILVPECELKWTYGNTNLRPSPDSFNFTKADWMVNFAKNHGLLFRGHTLVWHDSLPSWFKETVNIQNAGAILENHISTVVKRYAGKIHSWDVVNEVIRAEDGRNDKLRISPW